MKNLVIVESPGKIEKIQSFLGKDYKVMSSYGHIRDLKKKGMSVDIDSDFTPVYEIPAEKKELVRQLKAAVKEADTVLLASDEDREGEAIAWHLYEVLGLKPENTLRIVFHEITKPALLHAIENPRSIDMDLVNAQQTRRILDRIVGFELSPILWKKIKPALSAGRVQSVAVRLVCERENEINNFKPQPFFRVNAIFSTNDKDTFKAELKHRLDSEAEALEFLELCKDASFNVRELTIKPVKRSPLPPFTTSTLQQEAGKRLGFSVNTTMRIAQKLYEDGWITYMRTDSTNLSELALRDIASTIKSEYGDDFLTIRHYHTTSKGAQEAHEAIRPTYVSKESVPGSSQEQKLYDLIRKRTLASQMTDATLEKSNAEISISNSDKEFRAGGESILFEGFMKAWEIDSDSNSFTRLPRLTEGEALNAETVLATQRFTMPPARYTEGKLVEKMEALGIGRPATYAQTISTIQSRDYIRRGEKDGTPRPYDVITLSKGNVTKETLMENTGSDKGKLVPTDVGMVVNEFLTEYFPDILDYNFTAKVEEKFDDIAKGKLGWKNEMEDFYTAFHPSIEKVDTMRLEHKVGERVLGTDPKSGKPVSVKIGRFGPVVQIGEASDDEKPQFASLLEGQSIQDITLEQALKLFELPRTIGIYEGETLTASIGRFGPYVRFGKTFVSIPKELAPQTITLEEAITLINNKREEEANRLIKEFPEMPGLEVLNGRFGPYIAYKKEGARKAVNYKIPKGTDPNSLTLDDIKALMEKQDAAPAKKPRAKKK
ncbi:MAG: type I DNA topoisomerase [Muribaculaceae bacterium]|nr:type I DNA topoisomerase [Muribaculaceae bacterium]